MRADLWPWPIIARLVVMVAVLAVKRLASLIPSPDGQSVMIGAVFIAVAIFLVVHSHKERRSRAGR